MDSWPEWREKLIQFAKLESATWPVLKKLLGDLESKDSIACPDGECLLITHSTVRNQTYMWVCFRRRPLWCSLFGSAHKVTVPTRTWEESSLHQTFWGMCESTHGKLFYPLGLGLCSFISSQIVHTHAVYYYRDWVWPTCIMLVLLCYVCVSFPIAWPDQGHCTHVTFHFSVSPSKWCIS